MPDAPRIPLAPARRAVRAAVIAFVTFLFFGGLVGFAAAGEPTAPLPERFGVPAPWIGDRGEYNFTVVQRTDDGFRPHVEEEAIARFEWLPPRDLLDADGHPHRVNDLRFAMRSLYGGDKIGVTGIAPGSLDEEKRGFTYGYDVASGHLVAMGLRADQKEHHENMLTFFRPGDSASRLPLCGIQNPLQGQQRDTDKSVRLFSDCNIEQRGDFSASFKATTTDTIDGRRCLVYARESGLLWLAWDDSEIYVWMCDDIPYPARIAFEHQAVEDRFSVYRLASWSRGQAALDGPEARPDKRAAPVVEWAPREPWGPNDEGISHPFRLSDAYRAANTPGSPMARFLQKHADAYVMDAHYKETPREEGTERSWWFVLTDGIDALPVGLVQTDGASGRTLRFDNQTERAKMHLDGSYGPSSILPPELPTVKSLARLWEAYRLDAHDIPAALSWSFVIRPTVRGCANLGTECTAFISFWVGRATQEPSEWYEHRPRDWSLLQVTIPPGTQEVRASSYSERPHWPSDWEPAPALDANTLAAFRVDVGTWRFPMGSYAIGAGVLAVLAGLAYWAWPTMKSIFSLGFFSRLERPRALEHASRAQLHALVEANPGIHFQELRRRLAWSPSRLRHHLGKLVEVGLLTEVRTPGYSCYHAAGTMDRRLAHALPALKSAGARAVLRAVLARGRIGLQDLARDSRLDGATVHYHVRRLTEAGLIRQSRQGRTVLVEALGDARAALAGTE